MAAVSSNRVRRALTLTCILVALAGHDATVAHADEPTPPAASPAVEHARILNQTSVSAYLDGRFAVAAAGFEEAIALAPNEPVLFLNLGKAREATGDRPRAVAAYERYLVLAPAARDRVVVEAKVTALHRELAELAAREEERISRGRRDAANARSRPVSVVPFIVGGIGLVGLGVGAALGISANGKLADARNAVTGADAKSGRDAAHDLALGANVAFVAGGALLVTGAVWAVLDSKRRSSDALAVGFDARGVVVRGDF